MRRVFPILWLSLAVGLPAVGEEISLKDGTKIVGHMTALSPDKVEVETSYGKMHLKRSDIVTINFPENSPNSGPESAPAKTDSPKVVDESIQGARYLNKTGKFSLTLPQEWVINPDIRRAPETLTVLSSRDKMRFLLVMQEEYPGSLDSYKDVTMLAARGNFSTFEETEESKVTIDGKSALLVFYRGVPKKGGLPLAFVSAIMPSGNTYTKMTAWCVEPLFRDVQPTFEKILTSYRSTGAMTAAAPSSRP
jgi:PsbP-like protein